MGYTHYWNHDGFSDEAWEKFLSDAKEIFARNKDILANMFGEKGTRPEITNTRIAFNGIEDQSHETCQITKKGIKFDFCKTALKDYDPVVVEILKAARKHNPTMCLRSDGGENIFSED